MRYDTPDLRWELPPRVRTHQSQTRASRTQSPTLPRISRIKTQVAYMIRQYNTETLCVGAVFGGVVTHLMGSVLWIIPLCIFSASYDAVLCESQCSYLACILLQCASSSRRTKLEEHEWQAKTALLCDLVPEHVVAELVKDYGPLNNTLRSNPYGEPRNSLHALAYCSSYGSGLEILVC